MHQKNGGDLVTQHQTSTLLTDIIPITFVRKKTMQNPNLEIDGFEEVRIEYGMADGSMYTDSCSGSRSDCCTRTCSRDGNFTASEDAWEVFLKIEGGQVQY